MLKNISPILQALSINYLLFLTSIWKNACLEMGHMILHLTCLCIIHVYVPDKFQPAI